MQIISILAGLWALIAGKISLSGSIKLTGRFARFWGGIVIVVGVLGGLALEALFGMLHQSGKMNEASEVDAITHYGVDALFLFGLFVGSGMFLRNLQTKSDGVPTQSTAK